MVFEVSSIGDADRDANGEGGGEVGFGCEAEMVEMWGGKRQGEG